MTMSVEEVQEMAHQLFPGRGHRAVVPKNVPQGTRPMRLRASTARNYVTTLLLPPYPEVRHSSAGGMLWVAVTMQTQGRLPLRISRDSNGDYLVKYLG